MYLFMMIFGEEYRVCLRSERFFALLSRMHAGGD